ncbi:hypothetical protein ACLESD_20240 [Pyxidicoccus sp. 3LFB2]
MQLRKMMLMLTALGAMSGFMVGCGDDAEGSATCTTNDDCGEGEICHPTSDVCVQTCSSAADCPDTAKTCAPLGGAGPDAQTSICKCSTDQFCNGGPDSESTDLVCNADQVCVTRCTADADCTSGACNEGTGKCEGGGTNPGGSCTGEGRSTCAYGQICTNGACAAPPTPACENYTNFNNKDDLGTTGSIIYKTELLSAETDSFCAPSIPKRLRIRISAYSSTPFPERQADLNGFFYVLVNGTPTSPVISSSAGNYVRSGTNNTQAQIIVSICREATSTTTSTGFYFTDGNFACFQANYQ